MGGRWRKFNLSKGLHWHSTRGEIVLHAEMRGVSVLLLEVAMSSSLSPGGIPHTPGPGSGPRQTILFLLHTPPTGLSSEGFTGGVCETRELLNRLHTGGQEVREGWVSTVEEVMHTSSRSETVARWLATGLPECEESQPAASKRIKFPHNLLPDAI